MKEINEIASKAKIENSITIGDKTFGYNEWITYGYIDDRLCIYIGNNEDNWLEYLFLDDMEIEGGYCDGDFEEVDEVRGWQIAEMIESKEV